MRTLFITLCILWTAFVNAASPQASDKELQAHWLDSFQDQTEMFSFEGYRLLRYRSPTPLGSDDAVTLTTEQLQTLLLSNTERPALLNVQPIRWQQGLFVENEPFYHIPGSTWIPNVGMGELSEGWENYFRHHLSKVTKSRQDFPIVLYCRADCWMSWNAVKRAASWGYSTLYWYRDGVDGWREADLELIKATPEPYPVRRN